MLKSEIYCKSKKTIEQSLIIENWYLLHQYAISYNESMFENTENLPILDGSSFKLLKSLNSVNIKDWSSLCEAAGPTVYGAVGLSWCQGAQFLDVVKMWLSSGFILKPLPEYMRPARFINPAMLGELVSLTEIINSVHHKGYFVEEYDLALCIRIAALKGPLIFDISFEGMKSARPQIAAFLKAKMLEKPQHTAEEADVIKAWDAIMKGSVYDIWEGA